jgi:hypothetical protein
VSLPARVIAGWEKTAPALVRYVETKALIGGTTTGQGIRTRVAGGAALFRGAMRNVEEPDADDLAPVATRVPNLYPNDANIEAFRRSLDRGRLFYHLSEGTNGAARDHFADLQDHDLIGENLIGIHSLGLRPEDLSELAEKKAKVVWSPFSNLLLYGKTLDPRHLVDSGVVFGIGCDWTPSGSKNLLGELKVARAVANASGAALSARDLVAAVTSAAAEVTGWYPQLGVLRAGSHADLLVVNGRDGNAYDALIDATEKDIELVVVGGVARYGIPRAFEPFGDGERWDGPLGRRLLNLHADDSPINDLKFERAISILEDAVYDLAETRRRAIESGAMLASDGNDPTQAFAVELDMEPVDLVDPNEPGPPALAADWTKMADSVDLDAVVALGATEFLESVAAQPNLEPAIVELLRETVRGDGDG